MPEHSEVPWSSEYRKHVLEVDKKISAISDLKYLKLAFDEIHTRLRNGGFNSQPKEIWDSLIRFLYRYSEEAIIEFDKDIGVVMKHSSSEQRSALMNSLKADDRKYVAGRFEVFTKSRLFRQFGDSAEFDYRLPNGRDVDIRLFLDGRYYFLECSVRTDTDESRRRWENGIRCGSENPYSHCIDVYYKVFDKIAKAFDPNKSQMSEEHPNILLISFYTPKSTLYEEGIDVDWALNELFSDQPSSNTSKESIPCWLDKKIVELGEEGILSSAPEEQDEIRDGLFRELKKIGGIMLFDNRCRLKKSRINYLANESNRLSHSEMAELEEYLSSCPSWAE